MNDHEFARRIASAFALVALTATAFVSGNALAAEYIYTINNDTQQNGVAVFERNADGSLREVAGSPFATGGKGLSGGDIDQQGAVRVAGNFVLAVNPGSGSVAVLRKGPGGQLAPVAGSPFASGGNAPLSLTVHGGLVYVANQAPPFANPTSMPNITGFYIGGDGKLVPIARSTIGFSAGHGPAQVEFSPSGEIVVATAGFQEEATSAVSVYKVQADGTLKEGSGSPVHIEGASGDVGFSWSPTGDRIFVSNFRGSAVAVFSIDATMGSAKQIGGVHPTEGQAACWTVLSAGGKTLYAANFVSNSVSAFAVAGDGKLTPLGVAKRRVSASNPDTKDMTISKDGKFLYVVGSGAKEISAFSIGSDGNLTELPEGKSPSKLAAGTNILGLAAD